MMTVAELIAKLSAFPPEMRVVASGYEQGYDDIRTIDIIPVRLNAGKGTGWYNGEHGHVIEKTARTTDVVHIKGRH